MTPDIPWYITAIILAINVVIATAVWRIFSTAAGRSGLPAATRQAVQLGLAFVLAGWLVAALVLAPGRALPPGRDPFAITPLIPLFSVGPLALIGLAVALWA